MWRQLQIVQAQDFTELMKRVDQLIEYIDEVRNTFTMNYLQLNEFAFWVNIHKMMIVIRANQIAGETADSTENSYSIDMQNKITEFEKHEAEVRIEAGENLANPHV